MGFIIGAAMGVAKCIGLLTIGFGEPIIDEPRFWNGDVAAWGMAWNGDWKEDGACWKEKPEAAGAAGGEGLEAKGLGALNTDAAFGLPNGPLLPVSVAPKGPALGGDGAAKGLWLMTGIDGGGCIAAKGLPMVGADGGGAWGAAKGLADGRGAENEAPPKGLAAVGADGGAFPMKGLEDPPKGLLSAVGAAGGWDTGGPNGFENPGGSACEGGGLNWGIMDMGGMDCSGGPGNPPEGLSPGRKKPAKLDRGRPDWSSLGGGSGDRSRFNVCTSSPNTLLGGPSGFSSSSWYLRSSASSTYCSG
jgi:hypothetical protein